MVLIAQFEKKKKKTTVLIVFLKWFGFLFQQHMMTPSHSQPTPVPTSVPQQPHVMSMSPSTPGPPMTPVDMGGIVPQLQ